MSLTLVGLLIAGAAAAAGAAAGRAVARARKEQERRRLAELAQAEARALLQAAEFDAAQARRAAEVEARELVLTAQRELDSEATRRQAELTRREAAVAREEARAERLEGELRARDEQLRVRADEQRQRRQASEARRREAEALVRESVSLLEKRAGEWAERARARIQESLVEEVRAEAGARLRLVDASPGAFEREAKKVISTAMDRYAGDYGHERMSSSVALPPAAMQRLIGKGADGRLRLLEDLIGVKLSVNDSGEAVYIETLDGVARELARRVLAVAANLNRPFPDNPRPLVNELSAKLESEINELGVRAFKELDIPLAHAEINRLVGRLRYRTSYTQNQWQHAIEVGFLCGLMADELGEDRLLARRAGLLHDIGKAVSHEMDGSHAVIGGDYARRLGEREDVANAIAAHHADEPPNSVLAHITAAGDALSGARPGARREIVETYGRRVEDLERIAESTPGVQRAFALQAGRELRVLVDGHSVSDLGARDISLAIARRVEDELTYPGQIRVTVIRQLRSEAYAR